MSKKIFGLILILFLLGIVVVNIVNNSKEKFAKEKEENPTVEIMEDRDKLMENSLEVGSVAPNFQLNTLDGKSVSLKDYRGKKVILNFWASWCPPCKAEMPHMQNYYESQAQDQNVEILAVNLTKNDKGIEKIRDFVKEYGLTFPIPLDEEGEIGPGYQAFTIPTTYMIQTDGTIYQKIVGPMDEELMENAVSEME
ncbi:peroxiredoxin [Oikeobacillus pervagus]|uniref:Peroxiredoxin n=1 Tax=Oikeobacillus pervagus TaxID=1325931 RepID=A0AAJ1WJ03_9BACI|nr:redoxin domain-containing protein [Oikeobacillus pervagus]MDQ0214888.1 peroxiredoxin [Oikeobacillus pervagus]